MMTEYPELEKLKKVRKESQNIGTFLEWLFDTKKYQIARYLTNEEFESENNIRYSEIVWKDQKPLRKHIIKDDELIYVHFDIEKMLAEYFGIDLDKCEKERQAILNALKCEEKSKDED